MLADVKHLRQALNTPVSELDVRGLFPMFAPARFFATGQWPGPFMRLGAGGVGMTWALGLQNQSMRYLDRAMCAHWESTGADWRSIALENLQKATGEQLFTHGLGRKTDGTLFCCAMMHPDGWGPSRLLLSEKLEKAFPEGYRVAIPEMSCGFAMSTRLDAEENAAVMDMIGKCFEGGTRPLAPGIFEPHEILGEFVPVAPH